MWKWLPASTKTRLSSEDCDNRLAGGQPVHRLLKQTSVLGDLSLGAYIVRAAALVMFLTLCAAVEAIFLSEIAEIAETEDDRGYSFMALPKDG